MLFRISFCKVLRLMFGITLQRISRVSRSSIPCTAVLPVYISPRRCWPLIWCKRSRRSLCIFTGLGPTKVSSLSTAPPVPPSFSTERFFRTSRTRCNMHHADFWVIFSVRAISALLTPFLQLQTIQKAVIHLSMPSGESSKMVPSFTENCFLHPLQNHIKRVCRNECSVPLQRGQVIFFPGQRRLTA